ncbi:endocuticle structural protein SgAbd-6-like [Bacillus rossius redtenbacheri]|uniref:endocuticle structural protein SgAbd-6-like n=1 Tax=Bacillus rossius redtenbacheri TaxID=93214 RepID=UPI002FDEA629
MKAFQTILLGALLAAAAALDSEVKIMSYVNDVRPDGYDFSYELSDGTMRQEKGTLRDAGTENEVWEVIGFSRWFSPDGQEHVQEYRADNRGGLGGPALGVRAALAGKK